MGRQWNILALLALLAPVAVSGEENHPQPPPSRAAAAGSERMVVDASSGSTLGKLFSDLGADVEWWSDAMAAKTVTGKFTGSREAIAEKLLEGFNFAIFYNHSRMRVVVAGVPPKTIEATTKAPDGSPEAPQTGGFPSALRKSGV